MNTLNLEQAAAFLHLHPDTLRIKVKVGEVPAAKLGKRWVFLEIDLIDHLRSKYTLQASQGEHKESTLCHSINEMKSGGTKSDSEAKFYKKALGLPTR